MNAHVKIKLTIKKYVGACKNLALCTTNTLNKIDMKIER
jgi:hypothetical protein